MAALLQFPQPQCPPQIPSEKWTHFVTLSRHLEKMWSEHEKQRKALESLERIRGALRAEISDALAAGAEIENGGRIAEGSE